MNSGCRFNLVPGLCAAHGACLVLLLMGQRLCTASTYKELNHLFFFIKPLVQAQKFCCGLPVGSGMSHLFFFGSTPCL